MKKTLIIIAASFLGLLIVFFVIRGIVLNQAEKTTVVAEEATTETKAELESAEDDEFDESVEELVIELNDHQAVGGF